MDAMEAVVIEQAGGTKLVPDPGLLAGGTPGLPCIEHPNGTDPHPPTPPIPTLPSISTLPPIATLPSIAHLLNAESSTMALQAPLTTNALPSSLSAVLDSLTSLQGPLEYRSSSPLLHANEELLSEDELEGPTAMETHPLPTTGPLLSISEVKKEDRGYPPTQHSGSLSPYPGEDDSFASFVAREVYDSASALGDDQSSVSHSRSPTPNPPGSHREDLQALVSLIQAQPSQGPATIGQFGITAQSPAQPVQLPEEAPSAPLDMTTHNFPKRSKYAHRAAISAMHPYNRTRGGGPSVAKTLDLLKAVLQTSFNREVRQVCDDYRHIFNLAANNIRENTGDNVPDSTLKLLVCKMLEESLQGYRNSQWEFPSGKLPTNEKVVPAKGSPMSTRKAKTERGETRYGPPKRVHARKPPTDRHTDKNPGWRWGMDKRRVDPVKWEPDKLTVETNFVLGVNVNKALGHGANRGKVYYLHPELFKYACDGDDKTWLYENKHLPVHGGKAFLMIFAEVEALVKEDGYYKDNPDIWVAVKKLQSFAVPHFMVEKMKSFMRSVQGYFAQETSSVAGPSEAREHLSN